MVQNEKFCECFRIVFCTCDVKCETSPHGLLFREVETTAAPLSKIARATRDFVKNFT